MTVNGTTADPRRVEGLMGIRYTVSDFNVIFNLGVYGPKLPFCLQG